MKEKWVEKVENTSARSNTWASRSRAVVFVNDSRVEKAPAEDEDAQLRPTVRVFRQLAAQLPAKSALRWRCPQPRRRPTFQPRAKQQKWARHGARAGNFQPIRREANQRRDQSASGRVADKFGAVFNSIIKNPHRYYNDNNNNNDDIHNNILL